MSTRHRRTWPEVYAKDMLGTILECRGQVIMEHEIVQRRLRADMLFLPEPQQHSHENLGIVDRMLDLGPCLVELFSRPPGSQTGLDCVSKHLAHHAQMRNHARRNHMPAPPRPGLWMISPGRPRSLIADMNMKPMADWPAGFYHLHGKYHVHLIVVRELPLTADTLLLRLLDNDERLERAMAEIDALPTSSRLRQRLAQVALAWQPEIPDTSERESKLMMSPETQARYDEWERKTIKKGIEQGRKEGRKAGRKEGRKAGERALLRKLLTLRFGTLPADAEQRLKRASLAELERWAERVLSARTLAAVFAD